jgi:DNA (cytosine-5)-methyltransferase 1
MTEKLRVLDLFSGIGGFSLGLERTGGFETVAFCEIEEFPRKILAKHWPKVPCYDDVRTISRHRFVADGVFANVITAGFPCQDISASGLQKGIGTETRSGLYRQAIRLVAEIRPIIAIFENVVRFLSGPKEAPGAWFWQFLSDLAEIGYDAEWHCITAASIGAPHERDRVWIIAYPDETQLERGRISSRIHQEHTNFSNARWGQDKPGVVRTLDGVPNWMDRVGTLGNAVVPQIPELIGNAILAARAGA